MVCCSLLISLLQCLTSMIVEYILVRMISKNISRSYNHLVVLSCINMTFLNFTFGKWKLNEILVIFNQKNISTFRKYFVSDVPGSGADVDPRELRQLLRRVRGAGPARPRPQLPRQPGLRHHLHPLPGAAVLCCIVLNIVLYSTVM